VTTRVRNQRGEGERLRTALLDAAAELLAESQDVEQLSVRAVTARAGVSPTALYLHFEDKEELTRAVRERCMAALAQRLRLADEEHAGDPFAQLVAMGLAYLRFAYEQPGQYAILFHTRTPKGTHHKTRAPDLGVGDECFALLVNAVTRCVRKEDEERLFELACELWLPLHGRAMIRAAMPDFPLPDEESYVRLLAGRMLKHPKAR
jgi:AcrR family transcriptional regulator